MLCLAYLIMLTLFVGTGHGAISGVWGTVIEEELFAFARFLGLVAVTFKGSFGFLAYMWSRMCDLMENDTQIN